MAVKMRSEQRKLVVIGDGECGKTCLLMVFARGVFPGRYSPTVFETYVENVVIDDVTIALSLWDTAGQEDWNKLRPLSYPNTDVILVCFSVDNRDSLYHVEEVWVPEVKHHCPDIPIILIGNKTDLREDKESSENLKEKGVEPITKEEGKMMAKKIGAAAYLECSAKLNSGVKDVFDEAAKLALYTTKESSGCCAIS
eukprot:GHVU01051373.1.p1 GENE.GHVU01051373.1~~GHVU01051373.1.p1  ORF type:complete len:197 (-),score=21.89 GHVU01051373.1:724-1314(-)